MLVTLIESHVKPEKRDEFIAFIKEHARLCLEEPGCAGFDILEDTTDPNTFYYYEVYKDEEGHAAHMQTPQLARYREKIPEFRTEAPAPPAGAAPARNRRLRIIYPPANEWRKD